MNTTTDFRYPGSRPFNDTSLDRRLFFGRKHEKASLLHMVLAENLVVLFAKSGLGKTSLLNAGLMQPLRQREYIPFMIRLNIPDIGPLQALYEGIKDVVDRNRIEYTPGEENTLWQYFKTVEFWSSEDTLLTPVLILDQFEELFTLRYSPEKRKAFITQLADLVKDRVPKDLRKTLKPGETLPYGEMPPKVKIIISIREDFLGQLEELAHEIPDILHNRFRLVALSREQAKKAIVEPARLEDEQIVTASFQYAPETVEAMLDFFCERRERKTKVRTDEVEPFQLQLLCQHIESKVRKKVDKEGAAGIVIQKNDLGGEAGMRGVLKDFYVNQINRLHSSWKKRRVRSLCEKRLISDTDRRLSLEEEMIERKYKVPKKLLADLVNSRLLRAEPRVGSVYYELSHDTLVEPIRKSQSERRARRAIIFGASAIFVVIIFSLFQPWNEIETEREKKYKIFENARALISQEKYDDAIKKYDEILKIDKKFNLAHVALGNIYFQKGEIDKEIGNYEEAMKNYKIASEAYEEALKTGDKSHNTFRNLAVLYTRQGELDQAFEVYKRAINASANNAYIYTDLVRALKNEGMEDQVDIIFEIASKAGSKDPSYYFNFAAALFRIKEYDDAIQNFRKAVQLNPEDAKAYNYLGRAFNRLPNYPEAKENFKKAMELSPENFVYKANFAEANLTTENYYEAFIQANEVVKKPNISRRYQLAMRFISISSLLFQGKRPEAFGELKEIIAVYKSPHKYYWGFSWSYEICKTFIKKSNQLKEDDKILLLKLIDVLESPKPEANKKLQELESYLSTISKQYPYRRFRR